MRSACHARSGEHNHIALHRNKMKSDTQIPCANPSGGAAPRSASKTKEERTCQIVANVVSINGFASQEASFGLNCRAPAGAPSIPECSGGVKRDEKGHLRKGPEGTSGRQLCWGPSEGESNTNEPEVRRGGGGRPDFGFKLSRMSTNKEPIPGKNWPNLAESDSKIHLDNRTRPKVLDMH